MTVYPVRMLSVFFRVSTRTCIFYIHRKIDHSSLNLCIFPVRWLDNVATKAQGSNKVQI